MRVCVLGAGVTGLTTAWYLAERGYEVTIVDRRPVPAAETSHANGAQLSYSYVAPFASPSLLKKIPAFLLGLDPAVRLKPPIDLDFVRWALAFVRCCSEAKARESTAAQLALAQTSRVELQNLSEALQLEFYREEAGKLVIFRKVSDFQAAEQQVAVQRRHGSVQAVLSSDECLRLEPALRLSASSFAGGVFTADEQVGDCASFCQELFERLTRRNNVRVEFGVRATRAVVHGRTVTAIETDAGPIDANLFVVCLGPGAAEFCKSTGFRIPVYPIKGYSLTLRAGGQGPPLTKSVTDFGAKVVLAPFGERQVRVAGAADFVGSDLSLDSLRIEPMTRRARELLDVDLDGDLSPWCGLRPSTPDSRPIIGWSPLSGLLLNTGHGALGWTLACGSARLAADLVTGEAPPLDPSWFGLKR